MPKILHLITSLGGGGTENFLFQIVTRSPASFRQRVLFLKDDGVFGQRLRDQGVAVGKTSFFQLVKTLRAERPDVLHTCLFRAHQAGRWAGHQLRLPVVLSSQRAIDSWQKPWHRLLDRWTLRWCDGVFANSLAAQQLIEQRRGSRSRPLVQRLPNGIDSTRWLLKDRWSARRAYGLPLDAVVGGSLMRLHKEKGADLIPAFAGALLTARADLHLVIGGTGPLEKSLREKTRGQPWSDRLHWLGWENDAARLYSALDFFWLLSREESFPQSLVEASALGIPWIAPDVGGTRELLGAASGSAVFIASAPQGAAHAAFELLRLLNERKAKAKEAAPAFRAQYSLDKMTAAFYHGVESFLAQNRSHSL